MAEEKKPNQPAQEGAGDSNKKAAAKKPAAKKEKPPAIEDKPFEEFMQNHYVPALQEAIEKEGVDDLELSFAKQKFPIVGLENSPECWQVIGNWYDSKRHFNLYFPDEDIKGKKAFSCNEAQKPSTLESFLIDERKITLDLMVFGLVRRLNSQKWLGRN